MDASSRHASESCERCGRGTLSLPPRPFGVRLDDEITSRRIAPALKPAFETFLADDRRANGTAGARIRRLECAVAGPEVGTIPAAALEL